MTNLDYALIGVVVVLLAFVVLRIRNSRNRSAEEIATPGVKAPKTIDEQSDHLKTAEQRTDETSAAEEPVNREKTRRKKVAGSANSDNFAAETEADTSADAGADDDQEVDVGEISDPVSLIKTFSAPVKKRIAAIREAGDKKMVEAVPALIEALYEPDQNVSIAATESLGMIGDTRAIEPLLEISRRSDVALMKAVTADGEKNLRSDSSETATEENIDASPYKFKEMVVFKIDQLPVEYFQPDGSPLPRKELVIRGLKDNSQQMRQMAAKAAIGLDSDEIVEPLIDALSNSYEVESVRYMAAEALGGMQNDRSIECLLVALKDENVAVRYSAAAALSGRKDERIIRALIEAVNDPDRFVKASVAYALGTTGEPEALQALFTCAADENEVVRFSAAKAIAGFPLDEVLAGLEQFPVASEREACLVKVEVLAQVKDDRAMRTLRELLHHPDSEVSYKASLALMGYDNTDILEELIAASKRLDEELYSLAKNNAELTKIFAKSATQVSEPVIPEDPQGPPVKALSEIKNLPPNLEKLRKSLMDSSPNIRGSAANTLGDFQGEEAVLLLAAAGKDANEFVRASAISSLGKIASQEAIVQVTRYEKDGSEEVRYAVVKALSNSQLESAQECLARMAKNDRSKNVKRAARLALEKLSA